MSEIAFREGKLEAGELRRELRTKRIADTQDIDASMKECAAEIGQCWIKSC